MWLSCFCLLLCCSAAMTLVGSPSAAAALAFESRYGHCSVMVGNELWVIGGSLVSTGTLDSAIHVYDPTSHAFVKQIRVSGLPGIEGHTCSVTRAGFSGGFDIIVAGGWTNATGTPAASVRVYQLHALGSSVNRGVSDKVELSVKPDLPAPLRRHAALISGHTLYVFGGSHGGPNKDCNNTNTLLSLGLNPPAIAWQTVATTGPAPSKRYGHTASLVQFPHFQGYMVIVAGNACECGAGCIGNLATGGDYLSDVHVLDLDKLTWRTASGEMGAGGRTAGLDARYGHTALTIGSGSSAQVCVVAGTTVNSSCVIAEGGNATICVDHSADVLCLQAGWQTGAAVWQQVEGAATGGPVSRDRHTTTLLSEPAQECVDCGHGVPTPTSDYRWLDVGGFHSGSPVPRERVYAHGVHELRIPGAPARTYAWSEDLNRSRRRGRHFQQDQS